MNILIDTKSSLKESVLHYICMRMKFRGTVLGGDSNPKSKPQSERAASYESYPCVFEARVKH